MLKNQTLKVQFIAVQLPSLTQCAAVAEWSERATRIRSLQADSGCTSSNPLFTSGYLSEGSELWLRIYRAELLKKKKIMTPSRNLVYKWGIHV